MAARVITSMPYEWLEEKVRILSDPSEAYVTLTNPDISSVAHQVSRMIPGIEVYVENGVYQAPQSFQIRSPDTLEFHLRPATADAILKVYAADREWRTRYAALQSSQFSNPNAEPLPPRLRFNRALWYLRTGTTIKVTPTSVTVAYASSISDSDLISARELAQRLKARFVAEDALRREQNFIR